MKRMSISTTKREPVPGDVESKSGLVQQCRCRESLYLQRKRSVQDSRGQRHSRVVEDIVMGKTNNEKTVFQSDIPAAENKIVGKFAQTVIVMCVHPGRAVRGMIE